MMAAGLIADTWKEGDGRGRRGGGNGRVRGGIRLLT